MPTPDRGSRYGTRMHDSQTRCGYRPLLRAQGPPCEVSRRGSIRWPKRMVPPGRFPRAQEHPEEAAKRIAREHTGVELQDVRLSHIESFGNGAWHLIFHYRADLPAPRIKPGPNVAATEWFERTKLPARSEVAHGGWAIDVLKSMGPQFHASN